MQSILICKVMVATSVSATLPAPANDNPRAWGVPTRLANDGWWLTERRPVPGSSASIHTFAKRSRAARRDGGEASS